MSAKSSQRGAAVRAASQQTVPIVTMSESIACSQKPACRSPPKSVASHAATRAPSCREANGCITPAVLPAAILR